MSWSPWSRTATTGSRSTPTSSGSAEHSTASSETCAELVLRDTELQPLIRQKRRVKIEFSVERPLDVVRAAEPVLLPVKPQIETRDPAPAKRIYHLLSLLRRDDPVLGALEKGDRRRDQPRAVDRGTGHIEVPALRIRPDQAIEIARLEFVGIFCQRLQIADAVVACSGLEFLAKRQRGKRRVAARAGTADRPALRIDPSCCRKVVRTIHAISDINDAPVPLQPKPVFAAIAGAAAVIDVEHGEAAAGPILRPPAEGRRRGRGRPAVAVHEQRRKLVGGSGEIGIL